jgi:hypothetical protein
MAYHDFPKKKSELNIGFFFAFEKPKKNKKLVWQKRCIEEKFLKKTNYNKRKKTKLH